MLEMGLAEGKAHLYLVGDPYSRFDAVKVGITRSLPRRLNQIFTSDGRRRVFLRDGLSLFSAYTVTSWDQAKKIEAAILRRHSAYKSDSRTQGWLFVKPADVDVEIDLIAEAIGVNIEPFCFDFTRWERA
ncbi:hypothetical protein GOZ70_24185 [Vibrio parahaemolyticus]|nr:hypothetical protein [Vibrio parahaemolyticus]